MQTGSGSAGGWVRLVYCLWSGTVKDVFMEENHGR